ncbi:hypothetical protein E4T56_gene1999 [Termitomyces sp. T112]|nr:hypothetical protein E4T56_gene1999 [Termitomyces sp. T112]
MTRRETGRRLLTQEEHATSMIRIVYNREINVDHIAQRLSTTHTSVHNVARTITDKGGVWESTPEIQRPRPAVMAIPIPKPVAAKRTWLLPTSASSSRRFRPGDEARSSMIRPFGLPTPDSSVTYIEPQTTVAMPPDLGTFLRNLEHDMSSLTGDMEAQGFPTIEYLLAFAPWSEERLHELFKATLPNMTVPQRFILVNALKKYA